AALWSAKPFASGKTVQWNAHLGVKLGVVRRRNAGGIVQQHRNVMIFRDGQFLLQLVAEIGGVDHCRVFVDGIGEFVGGIDEHQLCASESNGAVKSTSTADHNHFMLKTGPIGELPDVLIVGSSDAASCSGSHGAGSARRHNSGLRACQLRETPTNRALKVQYVDEMLRCLELCFANFRKFERSTEVSPRAATIDYGLHAQTGVDVLPRILAQGRRGLGIKITGCDSA